MTDLDIQYRDFGYYMVAYLEVQEAKYSTDQEEAIECLMAMQSAQEQKRGRRLRRRGGIGFIYRYSKEKEKILWRYEAICFQARNTRIQAMDIHMGIRHKDE